MPLAALVGSVDVAQVCVAAFVLFFFGLVLHLRREDKREGYPLVDPARIDPQEGFPPMPPQKTFTLIDGGTAATPRTGPEPVLAAAPLRARPGYPLRPEGDPLADALGPAAFALRRDTPLIYGSDKIQVLPLRALPEWGLAWEDLDPRDMAVFGKEGAEVGTVADLWIDRSVKILRYLEIAVGLEAGAPRRALVPIYFTDISPRRRRVRLRGVPGARLAGAPALASPDQITAQEEDRVNAYFAGARFYAQYGAQA